MRREREKRKRRVILKKDPLISILISLLTQEWVENVNKCLLNGGNYMIFLLRSMAMVNFISGFPFLNHLEFLG